MTNYYKEDQWWASLYNDIAYPAEKRRKIEIHDATLRDGEQTPGVVFTVDDKIRIAEKLSEVGIERIEAGMPAVSKLDFKAIKEISKRNLNSKIFTFSRAMRKDIDMAVESGAYGVVIEVPIGYPKLLHQFGWTWEDVLERSLDTINYAKSFGLYTVFFPYDTTRARVSDLENLLSGIVADSKPDSVGVVDTMGCALPQTIEYLVKKVKTLTNGLPVEVHTHNDFGMAVAAELAGIEAGADVVHSCVNGLGERTGNAATEELAVAMKVLMGLDNSYQLDKLVEMCSLVEDISGVSLPNNKPIAGKYNYTRESGIGVDKVIENPLVMFATDPSLFKRKGDIVLGKKSGKASIEYYLMKNELTASDEKISEMLAKVKEMGETERRLIQNDEFIELFNKTN